MVRQWQTLFYNERYSNTDLHSKRIPDLTKLADAMGCIGLRCERPEDVDKTIEKAMSINDQPVVVDFGVFRDAMVWPRLPQEHPMTKLWLRANLRPTGIRRNSDETRTHFTHNFCSS